jgi:hypothetical protein
MASKTGKLLLFAITAVVTLSEHPLVEDLTLDKINMENPVVPVLLVCFYTPSCPKCEELIAIFQDVAAQV